MDPLRRMRIAQKLALAREFRSNPTPGERFAWSLLRRSQIHGLRFRWQHVLHGFIVDFYCANLRLVIEIDGEPHEDRRSREFDIARTEWLESAGYTVIRLTNSEVTRKRLFEVIGHELEVRSPAPGGSGGQGVRTND